MSRRLKPDVAVLVVLLPLLTVGAHALVRTEGQSAPATPPERTALTRVSLGCPSSPRGGPEEVVVGSAGTRGAGDVMVDPLRRAARPLGLRPPRLSSARPEGAVVVTGEDALAPGLLASRVRPGAAVPCGAPAADTWFAGVGARPGHASVVELTNPDPGPAVADLTVLAPSGPLDVPDVRGIRVPGRASVRLDLATIVPRRTELAVRVQVARGRLASAVWDRVDELGAGPVTADWLASQAAPTTAGLLLGLPTGPGERRLTLVNGGDSEVRADLRVISPESVFDPEGIEEILVPPGSVESVSLEAALTPEIRAGATGLLVEASGPVSAALRSVVGGDLAHTVASPALEEPASVIVPPGAKRLVVAGAARPGLATVVSRGPDGRALRRERIEVGPDRSVTIDLPAPATYVELELSRTAAVASVLLQSDDEADGVVVMPMRETVRSGLVPAVRADVP